MFAAVVKRAGSPQFRSLDPSISDSQHSPTREKNGNATRGVPTYISLSLCFGLCLVNIADASAKERSLELRITGDYGKLPLRFEMNRGQADRNVKFLLRGEGYNLSLTNNGVLFASHGQPPSKESQRKDGQY